MKLNFCILFVLLVVFLSLSCKNTSEVTQWDLLGKVKVCKETTYTAKEIFGNWESEHILSATSYNFSIDGQITSIEDYEGGDRLNSKVVYKRKDGTLDELLRYDSNGEIESTLEVNIISDNEIAFGNEYREYYENGKIIKLSYDYSILNWEYDKEGRQTIMRETNEKGETIGVQKFEYLEFDKNKNWIKKLIYEDDGLPSLIMVRQIEYYQ